MRYHFKTSCKCIIADNEKIKKLYEINKRTIRYDMNYMVNENLYLKNRIELLNYNQKKGLTENGYFIYNDLKYSNQKLN